MRIEESPKANSHVELYTIAIAQAADRNTGKLESPERYTNYEKIPFKYSTHMLQEEPLQTLSVTENMHEWQTLQA